MKDSTKDSSFIAFVKNCIFVQMGFNGFLMLLWCAIFVLIGVISMFFPEFPLRKKQILDTIFLTLTGLLILYAIGLAIANSYKNFKKTMYPKTGVPKNIKEDKGETKRDEVVSKFECGYCQRLEEAIAKLGKQYPNFNVMILLMTACTIFLMLVSKWVKNTP